MKSIKNIIISLIIFFFLSCMNLYSYSFSMFTKQVIWYFIGFILLVCLIKLKRRYLYKVTWVLYIILNVMLLYLLLFGNSINGSKAWIDFKIISFQPSEFMKIILIVLLSLISIDDKDFMKKSFLITLIPSILTFLEPDTGNVIFYLVILAAVLLYYGKVKRIGVGGVFLSLVILSFFLLYHFNKTVFSSLFGSSLYYRIDRVINLFSNETYQLKMALIGIGVSLPFGINSLVSVPEASTDFAFTLLIMNSGLIGLFIYIINNLFFNYQLLNMMSKEFEISKVIIFTFLIMKLFQEGIHILMNIGLFPITGITLPFISYGGSSLLSYFIILGVIFNNYKDMVHKA